MESFPDPVLPTVQGEPDYQTIHATRKFLQANSRAIDTHLGGGTLEHLGLIISDAPYAMIAPTTDYGPTIWITPQARGRAPATTDGTAAQISAAHHIWEEDVQTYRTCTSVQQALKKKITSVFEPMYLDILNDNMVLYASISARDMLDHLFETYGNITAVDFEINFEHMRRAFKSHFAAAHRQHKQMQGESAATAGYNSSNVADTHNEDQMAEATIRTLSNLVAATAADRGVVAALTQANYRLAKQLEDTQTIIQRKITVKLLQLPHPPVRACTDARTNPSAQRATQLRSVLARVCAVSIQNQSTITVP
jgi:ribosome-associated translation inhibitor RaiA